MREAAIVRKCDLYPHFIGMADRREVNDHLGTLKNGTPIEGRKLLTERIGGPLHNFFRIIPQHKYCLHFA